MEEKISNDIKKLKETIEQLQKENELFRKIIDNLPIGIQVFDKEGNSYLYNEKQKELLGLPDLKTGIGGFNILTDPNTKVIGAAEIYKKVYEGKTHEHQYEFDLGIEVNKGNTKKDKRTFHEKITPISNHQGEVEYALSEIEDITEKLQAEKALCLSEEKYRAFAENFTGIAFTGDFNYLPNFFHGAVEEITGYTEKEFLEGKPKWIDIISKEFIEEINISAKKLQTVPKYSTTREYKIFRKDGLQRWVRERIHNTTDKNKNITGVQGVIYDITINKIIENKVRENERKFKAIFDTIEIGITITNENGDIIDCNYASEKILGISKKEQLKRNHMYHSWKLIKPDHSKLYPKDFASVKALKENRTISNIEMGIVNKDKSITWISVSATPLKIPGFGVLIAYSDISDLKKNEHKLQELNNSKDKILSIISHDLRSPFNALIAMNKLAVQKIEQNNLESAKRIINSIQKTSQTTLNLLDNLLQWARSQTNRISFMPEPLNLKELTQEIIEFLLLNYNSKHINIENKINTETEIIADKNMLSTIIRNLISNAIKFTNNDGKIIIDCTSSKKEFIISVKDNGVGIEAKNQQNLFKITNKFTEYGTNEEKGTGLGLMLCKDFIERHNGNISIKSEKNEGTTVSFSIPVIEPIKTENKKE